MTPSEIKSVSEIQLIERFDRLNQRLNTRFTGRPLNQSEEATANSIAQEMDTIDGELFERKIRRDRSHLEPRARLRFEIDSTPDPLWTIREDANTFRVDLPTQLDIPISNENVTTTTQSFDEYIRHWARDYVTQTTNDFVLNTNAEDPVESDNPG